MNKVYFLLPFLLLTFTSQFSFSQVIVVNEVFNGFTQKTDWVELLVIQNNLDLRNYQLRDFAASGNPQNPMIFTNNPYWVGIKSGTLILITGDTSAFVEDTGKADFVIRLKFKSSDTTFLRGNQFNIATGSDAIQLRTPLSDTSHIHGIAWGTANQGSLPPPRAYSPDQLNGGFLAQPVAGASYYFTKNTIMTLSDFGVDANIRKDTVGGTPGRPNDSLSNGGNYQYIIYLRNLIGVQSTGKTVKSFSLKQNFPNPFNPYTFVEFEIPRPSYVTLAIFDELGRETASLINENLSRGEHVIKFDASGLPSGAYFYRLTAYDLATGEKFTESKSMVLVK